MLALEAEVDTYLAGRASERDQGWHRQVGAQRTRRRARTITTGKLRT